MIARLNNWLLALGALAVILNIVILFAVIPRFSAELSNFYGQNRYADGYDEIARNLAEGNGYRFFPDTAPTLMREPGYPLFLAGLFIIFGQGFTAVKVANLLLAFMVAILMIVILRKVTTYTPAVVICPLLFLFHPGILIAESRGGVEVLFTFLLMLFVLLLYRAVESKNGRNFLLSGVVLGLTVLVRSTPLLFPVAVFGHLIFLERHRIPMLKAVRNIGLMIGGMCVMLSPWIVRNYALTGKFVPASSVLGVSAHAGQYICSHLTSDVNWLDLDRAAAMERSTLAHQLGFPFRDGYYQYFYSSTDEVKFSSYLLSGVVARYKDSPGLFLKCVRSNMFNFWFAGKSWKSTNINLAVQLPLILLALIGAAVSLRGARFRVIAPLILLIAYIVAVCLPILAQARYSIPLIPILAILSGIAIATMHELATAACMGHRRVELMRDQGGKDVALCGSEPVESEKQ